MRVTLVSVACSFVLNIALIIPASAQSIVAGAEALAASTEPADVACSSQATPPPPLAITYSDGYRMRAKIHKISSFATLPLFGAEGIVGQSLYNHPTSGKKDAHLLIAGGIGALFALNTATGVWNLIEARKDPVHRGRRWAHSLMMLAADAGFLATAATGPDTEPGQVQGSRATHRAIAFTSIGLASASYLIMLFGGD